MNIHLKTPGSLKAALLVAATLLLATGVQAATEIGDDQYIIFYHNDALGSPLVVTDHNGNTLWHEHSDPYGRSRDRVMPTGKEIFHDRTESRKGYTGHIKDSGSDLVYMKARYYDPVIGRFYSNDPVGFTASNPMMFNRYAYANNNPYRYVDPTGMYGADNHPYFTDQMNTTTDIESGTEEVVPDGHPGIDPNQGFGDKDHDYEVVSKEPVCSSSQHCTYEQMQDYHPRFGYPGQSPNKPLPSGESGPHFVRDGWRVGGWIMSFLSPNLTSSRNRTSGFHVFSGGIVDRSSFLNPDGSWSVLSRGIGDNLPGIGVVNQLAGPRVFRRTDDAMREYIGQQQ